MKLFKLFLLSILIVLLLMLGFSLIGIIYNGLWYLFWIGVMTIGGYVGYKLLKKDKNPELEGQNSVSQIELDNARVVKTLEDYKRRQTKNKSF